MLKKYLTGNKPLAWTAGSLDNHIGFDVNVRITTKTPAGRTTQLFRHGPNIDQQLVANRAHHTNTVDTFTSVNSNTRGPSAFGTSSVEWSVTDSRQGSDNSTRCSDGGDR